jgi:uncharacterized protein YjiS (DUF1127 family)
MPTGNTFDFSAFDYRALTPDQRQRIKRLAMARARDERAEATRAMFGQFFAALRRISSQLGTLHRERRARRQAVAELHRLNNYELKDIGLRRGDIESAVFGFDRDPTRRRRGEPLRATKRLVVRDRAA